MVKILIKNLKRQIEDYIDIDALKDKHPDIHMTSFMSVTLSDGEVFDEDTINEIQLVGSSYYSEKELEIVEICYQINWLTERKPWTKFKIKMVFNQKVDIENILWVRGNITPRYKTGMLPSQIDHLWERGGEVAGVTMNNLETVLCLYS